jgi:hypothetical protein
MQDDLFRPTITARPAPARPPWRPQSIVYPAFFGGPLAAGVLGVLNGRRLALPSWQLFVIGAVALAGVGGRVAISAAVGLRFAGTVSGLVVWLVLLAFQRRPFRVVLLGGAEPASLVGPGLAAAIGGSLAEVALTLAVLR